MKPHGTRFYRTHEGNIRVVCTCGWSYTGTLADVHSRVATHDVNDVEPPAVVPFQSGLSEDVR